MTTKRAFAGTRSKDLVTSLRLTRAVPEVIEERYGVGTHILDALDEVSHGRSQRRLVSVLDDGDVTPIEADILQPGCNNSAVLVSIGERPYLT